MNLRDLEQNKALQAIKNELMEHGKALCVCCTGYGKGHLIKLMSKTAKELLVIVPKVTLVEDIAQRIESAGVEVSIYCASLGKKERGKVTVATKQSIEKGDISSSFIILDEAHRYNEGFLAKLDAKYILGLTATPFDANGFIYE
jgi:superfamily II DNA or RNA helicase